MRYAYVNRRAGSWPHRISIVQIARSGCGLRTHYIRERFANIGIRILRPRHDGELRGAIAWPFARVRITSRESARPRRILDSWRCDSCRDWAGPNERSGATCIFCMGEAFLGGHVRSSVDACSECGGPMLAVRTDMDICPACDRWATEEFGGETAATPQKGAGDMPGLRDGLGDREMYVGTNYDSVIEGYVRALEARIEMHAARQMVLRRLYFQSATDTERSYYQGAIWLADGLLSGLRIAAMMARELPLPE